jgi:hypothetical protein
MKNQAAVVLGNKRAAKLKKKLGKRGMSEYTTDLANKRHGNLDKLPA